MPLPRSAYSIPQSISIFAQSGDNSPLHLSMAPGVNYEFQLFIETTLYGSLCLDITMVASNSLLSGMSEEVVSSHAPFVTLRAGQNPSLEIQLLSSCNGKWNNTARIPLDLDRPLPKFRVIFWNHFNSTEAYRFEVDIRDVKLSYINSQSSAFSLQQ